MRNFYLLFAMLLAGTFSVQAQVDVTLRVDMSEQTVSADGIHVAGDFQGWDPSTTPLTDVGSGIYEVTLTGVADGTYEYKFVNGNAWGSDESVAGACSPNGNGNRSITVAGSALDLAAACFTSCDPCGTVNDLFTLTLQVDMNNEPMSATGVHVAGAFQGWDPMTTPLTDIGGGIYEVTLDSLTAGTYAYKFVNGNAWGFDESVPSDCATDNNRVIEITGNTTVPVVCFASCEAACPVLADPVSVTFRVDMNDEITAAEGIHVAGTFQFPAWTKDTDMMTDANSDGIYEYTIMMRPGEYQYKFINGNTDMQEETADFVAMGCGADNGVGGSNRVVMIENDTVLAASVYNTCNVTTTSIEDLIANPASFIAQPNPFTHATTLRFTNDSNEMMNLAITDVAGRLVRTQNNIMGNSVEIERGNLVSGLYFATIRTESGMSYTQKLILK